MSTQDVRSAIGLQAGVLISLSVLSGTWHLYTFTCSYTQGQHG